jgi:hypothetical protein
MKKIYNNQIKTTINPMIHRENTEKGRGSEEDALAENGQQIAFSQGKGETTDVNICRVLKFVVPRSTGQAQFQFFFVALLNGAQRVHLAV